MTDNRKILGKWGEQKAKDYLLSEGYRLLAENWRNRYGEIDLIMLEGETVVFVEVRTKKNNNYGYGFETVNKKKQEQLLKMANMYLSAKKWWNRNIRFDVISIDAENGRYKLRQIKNVIM